MMKDPNLPVETEYQEATVTSSNPAEELRTLRQTYDSAKIAADTGASLHERIEAYEDVMESEVGDTILTRARNLERELGFRQIYLKFEGGNPSGTQKDRISFAQCLDAIRRGYDAVTIATCGNYGVATAFASRLAGLRCHVVIPASYHTKRIQEMVQLGAEIIRVEGDYEAAVLASREFAERHEIYDANPGGINTPLQLKAYGEMAYEIYDELRDAPAIVAAPVSNGSTLTGVYKGFTSLLRRGKTSHMPRLIAGSTYQRNPIVISFNKGLDKCIDLLPEKMTETPINEPLINWHSIDGEAALGALYDTNGAAFGLTDRTMLQLSKLLREKEGLNVLPAATAGLGALIALNKTTNLPGDRYVVILTARKS